MPGYRWRRVTATLPAVVAWMIEGQTTHVLCVRGLPPGTVCIGTVMEDLTRISLVVEHESFDEIKHAIVAKDAIPYHPDPTFRTLEQRQAAVEDRYKQQMARLLDDLGLEAVDGPEAMRVAVRNTTLGLHEQLKDAMHTVTVLRDRLAVLEGAKT